ncbi:MAG: glutathione peroxidase [Bacteroidetes bacterium]|nr:MAG: glutathione peroxidase [Bacteroidota bacterium]
MKAQESIYDIEVTTIDGEVIKLEKFKGKKLLIVNTASKCGYTPQYEELEKLYEKYKDQLVVLGFPCNQFGGQEPGSEKEIKTFCTKNYGVTFPMFSKIDVKGENQHPLYRWLTEKELNGVESSKVKWNFHKYLIDENGRYIAHFPSSVKPMSEEILRYLQH